MKRGQWKGEDAPPSKGEEKADEPHPYSKDGHVRIVNVRDRGSDLWIWAIFLLDGIKIKLHPGDESVKGGGWKECRGTL
jgi:hypothetical protein